ncbi:MAG: pyrroline-5-carboxylate reductase [Phyllobacteriaceae bacterium]|nr:pyrroline-5-carboxylate reductase [Phyllobacteriaceae bacterium]
MIDTFSATSPLVLVGCGKMGGAMLTGWLDRGLSPGGVIVVEKMPSDALRALAAERGFVLRPTPPDDVVARVLLVAVKPQGLDATLPTVKPLVDAGTVVVSVVAGKTIATYHDGLSIDRIVRTIPNTPAQVGRGITAAAAAPAVTAADRALVAALLAAIGKVEWVEAEDQIDLVTAVSGSGPAYVFQMVEALAAAGAAAGLPAELSARLARATVEGAGELLFQSEKSAEQLRIDVTSPAGTTAAALAVLMDPARGLTPILTEAVAAAAKRSRELAG